MKKILNGIVEFHTTDYVSHKKRYESLSNSQEPRYLFITCSDSRVVPDLITKSQPGELFIVRNIANIVPPHAKAGEYPSASSAIEYAVDELNVRHVIVCGHSDCGGCKMLLPGEEDSSGMEFTRKWLRLAADVKTDIHRLAEERPDLDPHALSWHAEQSNVLHQMKNLLTYPQIAEKYGSGTLGVHGWHYIIQSGDIYQYNEDSRRFELGN